MSKGNVSIRRSPRMSEDAYREKLGLKRLTEFGGEMPDPVPMAPPVGFKRQPSIFENMREMVRVELSRRASEEGFETEEEAEDFNVREDIEPVSRHQYTEMDEDYVRSSVKDYNEKVASDKQAAAKRRLEASVPGAKPARQGRPQAAREALDEPGEPGDVDPHSAD